MKQPAPKERSTPPSERDTRTRLLDTAVQLFGARGFAAVSMRDIAQEASVNLAAINYHFSSKEKLWQEALCHTLGYVGPMMEDLQPVVKTAQQAGTTDAAEAAFKQLLERFLQELLQPHYQQKAALLFWEMMGTRQNLHVVVNDFFVPPRLLLCQVLQLLLPDASTATLDLWAGSVIGQCVSVRHCLPANQIAMKWEEVTAERLNFLVKHTIEFCLSAIHGAKV